MAADRIRVGEADVMIAAGTESMSMVPMMGNSPSLSPSIFRSRRHREYGIAYGMGLTAEKVAQQWKVSREAQDEFALPVAQKALAAHEGRRVRRRDHAHRSDRPHVDLDRRVDHQDPHRQPRRRRAPRHQVEGLAKLRTVFAARGSVTAGNSSQTSDGAGALILASEKAVKRYGLSRWRAS
jgi:acetyl-CoA acyltransferase